MAQPCYVCYLSLSLSLEVHVRLRAPVVLFLSAVWFDLLNTPTSFISSRCSVVLFVVAAAAATTCPPFACVLVVLAGTFFLSCFATGNRYGARRTNTPADVGVHLHQPREGHARTVRRRSYKAVGVGER